MSMLELIITLALLASCAMALHYRRTIKEHQQELQSLSADNASQASEILRLREENQRIRATRLESPLLQKTLLDALGKAGIQMLTIENGRVTRISNHEIAHRLGWSSAQIDALPTIAEIVHPDDRARVTEYHRRRLSGETAPSRYEMAMLSQTGERVEFEVAVAVVPDTGTSQVIALTWEIADRKRLERELAARAREFRAIAENSQDLIFRYDLECRRTYVNPAVCRLFRQPAESLLGQTPEDNPNLTEKKPYTKAIRHVIASGKIVNLAVSYQLDDRSIDYHVQLVPEKDAHGNVMSVFSVARDITTVRNVERRAGEFFATAPGFVYTMRRDTAGHTSLPFVSAGLMRKLGVSAEALRDDIAPLRALYHPADIERVQTAFEESARQLAPVTVQFRIHPPLGSERWLESRATPRQLPNAEIHWQGIAFDITERKQLEIEVAAREREFHTLAENLPDPVFRFDQDCCRVYVNAAAARACGNPAEELLGSTPADCKVVTKACAEEAMNIIRHVFATGESRSLDVDYPACNGNLRQFNMRFVPERDADGQITTVLGLAHDITELKAAQAQIARFLANSPGYVYTIRRDAQGHDSLPFVSPGIETLTGLSPDSLRDDMSPLRALYPPEDRERLLAAFAESAEQLTPVRVEFRIDHPQRGIFWAVTLATPEQQADGEIHWHGILLDISERKAIQRQRDLLELAIDLSGDSVLLLDENLHFAYVNRHACLNLGYSRDELLNKSLLDIAPDTDPEHARQMMASKPLNEPRRFETRHLTADGRIFPVEVCANLFLHDGKRYAMTVSRDISERKSMEIELRDSEAQSRKRMVLLQTILESSPEIIAFALGQDYRYLTFNEKHRETMRAIWGKEISIGTDMLEIIGAHPDRAKAKQSFDRALSGESFSTEEEFGNEACSRLYWQTFWSPIPGVDGTPIGLTCFVLNITERKRIAKTMEHERAILRTFFDALPALAWMKDTEGRYLACNPVFERFFGHPEADILGKTDYDYVDAELASFFRSKDAQAIAAGKPCTNEEQIVFADDGQQATLETVKAPVFDASGQTIAVLGVAYDITERKIAEAAREAALAEAERLARLRASFMAQMSHELRTPLNSILGFAQLMQREKSLPGEIHAWASTIHDNGEHLLALINEVLDFAKIEADKVRLDLTEICLTKLLAPVVASIRVSAENKGLRFTYISAQEQSCLVRVDILRLRQILLNLLGNAVKFTERGEIILHVDQPAPGRLRFEVRDTGPGIAADQFSSIFEPFEQSANTQRLAEGTGLGLAISRKLARMMNGEISVNSQIGQGSCFSLEFEIIERGPCSSADDEPPPIVGEQSEIAIPFLSCQEAKQLPERGELASLLEQAQLGYLRRISRQAGELSAQHPAFAKTLGSLAKAYRSKELINFLEHCLKQKTPQRANQNEK